MELLGAFKALADESRLRIVRLLVAEPVLNVGELTRILGLAQSSVSQKLAMLRKAGLVRERRENGFAWYELAPEAGDAVGDLLRGELAEAPDPEGDLARLAEVRRLREDRGDGTRKLLEPGRSWVAWARALGLLVPSLRVVDFGCGDGALTLEMASFAKRVDAIDRDAAALGLAREQAARRSVTNVRFHHGAIQSSRLRSASADLVVISHALHHMAAPERALGEAHRVLVPGGRVLVLELAPHTEEWVRLRLGHVWLGFSSDALAGFLGAFVRVAIQSVARAPFRVLIATGVRP